MRRFAIVLVLASALTLTGRLFAQTGPDLIVENLGFNSNPMVGVPATLIIRVTNAGTDVAPQFFLAAFLNQQTPVATSTGAAALQLESSLAAGASVTLTLPLTFPSAGIFNVAVLVDSEAAIDEINENNNFLSIPVTVLTPGVDLVITGINRVEGVPGLSAQFTLSLANVGATPSGAFNLAFFPNLFTAPTPADAPLQNLQIAVLDSQQVITLSFAIPVQDVPRAGTAWFVVDTDNSVLEDVESNNVSFSTWGISNDAPLIASGPSASLTTAATGEAIVFSAVGADANTDPLGYLWDFGDGTPLIAGATVSHAFAVAGTYAVTVTVTDGPFHSISAPVTVDVVGELVDLGTVRLSVNRGRFRFTLARPAAYNGSVEKLKSFLSEGNAGAKARYRNFRLSGTALEKGVFSFVIEFQGTKSLVVHRVRYRYTVAD